jgi:hypothetical protein
MKNNNKDTNKEKIKSSLATGGHSNFSDDENVKNIPIKLSILQLELKRDEMIRKYRETEYYKSKKDKR